MIAISEHLRKHGYDPDIYKHTQIPSIWDKLRTFFNLDLIDERENGMIDDDRGWKEFVLPYEDFHYNMMRRCLRGRYEDEDGDIGLTEMVMETDGDTEGPAPAPAPAPSLSATRADRSHYHNSKPMSGTERETRKRRRAATRSAADEKHAASGIRASTVDTEERTPVHSPAPATAGGRGTRSSRPAAVTAMVTRGTRSSAKVAARASAAATPSMNDEEEQKEEEEEEKGEEADEEGSEEEGVAAAVAPSKTTRSGKGRGARFSRIAKTGKRRR